MNMAGRCYTCGGVGHPQRLCPTNQTKGKGKGAADKGKGKGFTQKGYAKGKAVGKGSFGYQGEKGKGKGYQGTCWHCGKTGHKQAECRSMVGAVEQNADGQTDVNEVEIGGLWYMGNIDCIDGRSKTDVPTRNRFNALQEEDVDEQMATLSFDDFSCKECGTDEFDDGYVEQKNMRRKKKERQWKKFEVDILVAEKAPVDAMCAMTFNVTDATKILASVSKMTEAGNTVKLGPDGGTVTCGKTGRVAKLHKVRGIYLMKVIFHTVEGDIEGSIVVDSGAAENVMPTNILEGEAMQEKREHLNFVAANGKLMGNYGRKTLRFTLEDFRRRA